MFEVDEQARAVQQVSERVDTRGSFPARLHGGALLGITFTSTLASGAPCDTVFGIMTPTLVSGAPCDIACGIAAHKTACPELLSCTSERPLL